MCKKLTCDALLNGNKRHNWFSFFYWSKITFIFRIWSVARLWQDQRFISLEKIRNVVFESVTNVWPICDSFETCIRSICYTSRVSSETHVTMFDHITLMYDPSVTWPVTHMWFTVDRGVTTADSYMIVRLIWDQSVTHSVTPIWPIHNLSDDSCVINLLL